MRLFDYDKAAVLMGAAHIDLILAHTWPNVDYLTDYHWIRAFKRDNFITEDGKSYYASFVGIPREDQENPFYVGLSSELGYPEEYCLWIEDRRYWGASFVVSGGEQQLEVEGDVIGQVAVAVRERGLERGTIGIEWRQIEMVHFEALREALPEATFVDAEPLLWRLREIKGAEEIRRLRAAAEGTSAVFDLCFSTATVGMTEWDMDNFIGRAMAERGLFYNWIDIGFGPKGARSLATGDTRLRAGELMRLDLGGRYKGYPCDMARSLAVGGRVNAQAQRAHEVILETNRRLREALRPGVTGRELYRLCMASIEDGGYISLTRQAGHSLGRTPHEPPFMTEEYDEPVKPGMIIVLEPTIRVEGVGSVNIEDMMLVTEDGSECLTTSPRELNAFL